MFCLEDLLMAEVPQDLFNFHRRRMIGGLREITVLRRMASYREYRQDAGRSYSPCKTIIEAAWNRSARSRDAPCDHGVDPSKPLIVLLLGRSEGRKGYARCGCKRSERMPIFYSLIRSEICNLLTRRIILIQRESCATRAREAGRYPLTLLESGYT